jgi:hypothetical protein
MKAGASWGVVAMGVLAACGDNGTAEPDASTDATLDTTQEASLDAAPEVGKDGAIDVVDASTDAVSETPIDATQDVVIDVTPNDGGSCTSNAECLSSDYCEKGTGNCAGTGTCTKRPAFCPLLYQPVCGCDKATHTNACYSHNAGSSVDYTGVCE